MKQASPKARYRAILMEKRRAVLSGLGVKFDTLARLGRVAEDDQAQISHDEFISLRLNGMDYAQLRMIEEALDRLESGDYGICLSCEEAIAPKRLSAIPWARYCVECQEMLGADAEGSAGWTGQARKPAPA
jgi:RNA polymerase-binding transcription factor